jgi:hypothetical protein
LLPAVPGGASRVGIAALRHRDDFWRAYNINML